MELGTLWFGADIDLSKLQQKIQSGNQSILDSLKMNYDPQSYSQMVGKLKNQLASEIFHINIQTDPSVLQNIRSVFGGRGTNGTIAPFDLQNIQGAQNGVTSIHRSIVDFTRKILDQKDVVKRVSNDVAVLREKWGNLVNLNGRKSKSAIEAYGNYVQAKKVLREEQTALFALQQGRSRANLTLAEQRVAYREANDAVKQASLHLAQEKRNRIDATTALEKEKAARKAVQAELEAERRKLAEIKVNQARQNVERLRAKEAMKQQAQAARNLNSDHLRLNTTLAGGIHISTQLGSALSSLFAIDYARQFLGNVIEIGGQLEKQRISIGAILGDTVKASHLFEQIKGLALKSPFGVVELDQYTKQLSAYGFKYSELFDMTKRLADISAGAGTDIGRLTLALGHVRSATYLTGITLRQFSMNNIPMLKMLADYYTEVEKKAVSTADVQKRISKRQVSYEDVIEQIRRLTNEGGMFYNMQEKISESLSARFKNLRDAMDIMYGEMAEGTIGDTLKGLAAILLQTTRHWKEIGTVMGVAAAAFLLNKTVIGLNTITMNNNTAATLRQMMATKQLEADNLRVAATYRKLSVEELRKIANVNRLTAAEVQMALATEKLTKDEVLNAIALNKITASEARALVGMELFTKKEVEAAIAANALQTRLSTLGMKMRNLFAGIGFGTWATIATMVGMELWSAYSEWADRIDNKAKEMQDLIKSRVIDLEKIQKKINSDGKPTDKTALKGQIDDMKQVLANSEAYTKTIDEQLSKTTDLNKQYDILKNAIGDAAEKNKKQLDYQKLAGNMIWGSSVGAVKGLFQHGLTDMPLLNYFFNDDINKNMKQTLESYKDLRIVIDNAWEYKEAIKGVIEEMVNSGEISDDFAARLKNAPFEEQIRLLAESKYWDTITEKIIKSDVGFVNFADKIKRASHEVSDDWDEIVNDDIPKMMKKAALDRGLQEKEFNKWCLDNVDDFKMMLESIADQLDIKEPEIRRNLKRLFYDYVRMQTLADQMNGNEGLAAGALVGASLFSDETLRKLLDEDPLADIKDDTKGNTDNKNKKDKELEAAKTKLQQYKAFLSEYKKYREMYSREKTLNILETLFPDLKDDKGKFMGSALVDNYSDVLTKLRNSLSATTEARKKFFNEIDKTNADTLFDRQKEAMDKNVKDINAYTKRLEEQWKTYREIMKKTGGREDIAQMAFSDGKIWDETSKNLLAEFNRIGSERGAIPISFSWNLNEAELEDALGKENKDLIDLAKKIQEIIRGNYKSFINDTADAYSKSLSEAQKLLELERQRQELIRKRDADNDQSDEQRGKYNIQIAAKDKEIANQRWEAFKETEQWGRVFANLDDISTRTLGRMLDMMRALIPQVNKNEEALRTMYEAIDKVEVELNTRNPFAAMASTFSNIRTLRNARKIAAKQGGVIANLDLAKLLGVKLGSKVSKEQLDEAIGTEQSKFPALISKIGNKFKALQDVLSPVVELFDYLGNEDLSNIFSAGNNALGAAAQTASGLKALGLESLGPYGAAAAAGVSIVSSLFALHDKSLQKEIEASEQRQKEMENLSKNLETMLKRTLGGVYSTRAPKDILNSLSKEYSKVSLVTKNAINNAQRTKTYYDASFASLLAQRDEIQRQMDLEEDKKKSDSKAIADYKQQLKEMEDQINHFAEDMANALYDIDVKSWASELGDALFEAWQKGESGAEAFKKKASELIAELSKNIATTKLIETAMQPVLDSIVSEMKRTKGMLDEQSVSEISGKMAVISETLPDAFNKLMDSLNEGMIKAGLTNMKELAEDTESSTKNAIGKAITEQDTSLWSSYLNAMRLDVSLIRNTEATHLPEIAASVIRVSVLSQTQVTYLEQIANNTRRNADAADKIYDIMRKIDNGTTKLTIK